MVFSKIKKLLINNHGEDISRLIYAFPSKLHEDAEKVAKVIPFETNPITIEDGSEHYVDSFVTDYKPQSLNLRGEEIKIPCRVYFEEPEGKKLADLNRRQQTILHCIYLRHHNGFVRERHLTKIIEADDYFALPFQVLILGEYVEELISILDQGISDQNISEFAEFLSDNRFFWTQTQSRIVSYWDVYYRIKYPKLRDYVGQGLATRLNKVIRDY